MTELRLVSAMCVCLAILALPGLLIGASIRLRGLWLAAAAPPASFAVIGLTAMGSSLLGLPWSLWPVAVGALVAAGLGWGLTRLLRTGRVPVPKSDGWRWATTLAAATGGVLMAIRAARGIPSPDLFAQSFDNAFHLTAARFVLETGTASPWDVSTLLRPAGDVFFYPSGWHALVALVAELSNVPVTVASNACLIVIACLVWPLGAVLLTRSIFGTRTPLLIAAGAVSAGFATYPFMLITTMGTYPLVASIALLAPAIAAAVDALGLGSKCSPRAGAALVFAVALPALGAVHPSALVMLAVLTVPIVAVAATRAARARPERRRLIVLAAVLYVMLVMTVVLVVRTEIAQSDSLRSSAAQALGEVALSAFGARQITLVIAVATVVGLVAAFRRHSPADWVAIGLWATMAAVYVGTTAGDEFVRLVLGGPWYVDANRIAAFTPVVVTPLAAAGAAATWAWFTRWVRRRSAGRPALRVAVTATAVVAFAGAMIHSSSVRGVDAAMHAVFTPTDNALTSPVGVGPNERELVELIEQTVPVDDLIGNNPRDGSGLIYALTGRHMLTPYMLTALDGDRATFYADIADAAPEDPACKVAQHLNVRWVVQFHPDKVLSGDARFDGVDDIGSSPNVELVHKIGTSALYRITGCGFGDS